MRQQMRSELVKLRSTKTNLGLLIGMVGLVLLIVIITGAAGLRQNLPRTSISVRCSDSV
jgi:hypothetical protein